MRGCFIDLSMTETGITKYYDFCHLTLYRRAGEMYKRLSTDGFCISCTSANEPTKNEIGTLTIYFTSNLLI